MERMREEACSTNET